VWACRSECFILIRSAPRRVPTAPARAHGCPRQRRRLAAAAPSSRVCHRCVQRQQPSMSTANVATVNKLPRYTTTAATRIRMGATVRRYELLNYSTYVCILYLPIVPMLSLYHVHGFVYMCLCRVPYRLLWEPLACSLTLSRDDLPNHTSLISICGHTARRERCKVAICTHKSHIIERQLCRGSRCVCVIVMCYTQLSIQVHGPSL
jgi:hypothetical protein